MELDQPPQEDSPARAYPAHDDASTIGHAAAEPVVLQSWECVPRFRRGLALLSEGWFYARQAQVSVWDFAVELSRLRRVQLTHNDLRFLVLQGAVEHALELTVPGDSARSFRLGSGLVFARRTCFVLSTAGAALAGDAAFAGEPNLVSPKRVRESWTVDQPGSDSAPQSSTNDEPAVLSAIHLLAAPADEPQPHWDAHRLELRVGNSVIKRFTLPAPLLESVLAAFEERHWPRSIDNPLAIRSLRAEQSAGAHETLQNVVDALNRQQRRARLHFFLEDAGRKLCWQPVEPAVC